MTLIRLLLPALFAALSLATIAHAAEENVDPSTHLAYTPYPEQENLGVLALPELQTSHSISVDAAPVPPFDASPAPRLAPASATDVWQRIRNGFGMQELDSPLVAKHEQWYASRPDYVQRMTERSRRYLFYIVEEVESRGIPTEIALLPMIESAFNPIAYSSGRASGIWQFIPSTGKNFGMQQNWWYDERRDIISATNGALDYLQKLHDMFGDWQLALAAYNWGEGAVSRAQAKNRRKGLPTDFASLKLPPETRNYVPKLLAIKHIVADPASFGLSLSDVPNEPYFGSVVTTKHIDLKRAAELAEIPMEEFIALNPGHNRPVIVQNGDNILLLPVDKLETFVNNLDAAEGRLVSWQPYHPKKGERLDKLAPRFGLSVDKLKSINGLSSRSKVSNGQTLLVPIIDEEDEIEFEPFNTHLAASEDRPMRTIRHTVRHGETLASIARKHGISQARLIALNGGAKKFRAGQRIVIAQTQAGKRAARRTGAHAKRQTRPVARQAAAKRNVKVASTR